MEIRKWLAVGLIVAVPLCCGGQPLGLTRTQPVGVVDLGAYYSPADKYQHVLLSRDGSLNEIFFDPSRGKGTTEVARVPNTIAVDSYFAKQDQGRQMAIVLQDDGDIEQIWFSGSKVGSARIGNIAGAVDVAALEDDDGVQRALVLAADGTVSELSWRPSRGISTRRLFTVPGAIRIDAFQALDDRRIVAHVASADGSIREAFYLPGQSPGVSELVRLPEGIRDIASYYTESDHIRHVVALGSQGTVFEFRYHPTITVPNKLVRLSTEVGARRISAYSTPFDDRRHLVISSVTGEIKEIAFDPSGGARTTSVLGVFAAASTRGREVGPTADPTLDEPVSPATGGLTLALAGNEAIRYAVSLNAGIWAAVSDGPWQQLSTSPRYAQSIAVDPRDVQHILAGERDGDAVSLPLNVAGLWESRDAGKTWGYALNPLNLALAGGGAACSSQAIPSISFGEQGAVYAATDCGIARRGAALGSTFALMPGSVGLGPVTGVAVSVVDGVEWVWGRTPTSIILIRPGPVRVFALPRIAPMQGGRSVAISGGQRGSAFGFAAYGRRAAVPVLVAVPSALSPRVASLELDPDAGQRWWVDWVNSGSGAGLGGRIHLRNGMSTQFASRNGGRSPLFLLTAQKLYLGTPRITPSGGSSAARGVSWHLVAEGAWGDSGCEKRPPTNDCYELKPTSTVHTDFWDAHVSQHPLGDRILLATDGGVSTTPLYFAESSSPPAGPLWRTIDRGLHTQHLHKIAAVHDSYAHTPGMVVATVDNDAWWRPQSPISQSADIWADSAGLGDANWIYSDPNVPNATLVWRGEVNNNLLTQSGFVGGSSVYSGKHFRTERYLAPVRRVRGTGEVRTLEMLALAKRGGPQQEINAFDCGDDQFGTPGDGSAIRAALLRTTDYVGNRVVSPDPTNIEKWSWSVESDSATMPLGAQRVWSVAPKGGDTLYLYAEPDPSGAGALFRRKAGETTWRDITATVPAALAPRPNCAANGPIFPSPTDADVAYVQAGDAVYRFSTSTDAFVRDGVLTALLTRSGTYPMTSTYDGGNSQKAGDGAGHNVHHSQGRRLTTLADLDTDPFDDYRLVVASAFGGVFFQDKRIGIWQDLSAYLPSPSTAISSVIVNHEGVFVGLEGRSAWRIEFPEFAPFATFFSTSATGVDLGRLLSATGEPIRSEPVKVLIREPGVCSRPIASDCAPITMTVLTTDDGIVGYPTGIAASRAAGRVIRLDYAGGSRTAPSYWAFAM